MRSRVAIDLGGTSLVSLLLMMAPTAAQAQPVYSRMTDGPLFPQWRTQIERMVATGDRAVAHICIVGWREKADADVQQAYVIWPEAHRLITWMPSSDPDSLSTETHMLDLTKDVVANQSLVGGSTYLVTRAWVRNVERQCRTAGTELLIKKKQD